MTNTVTPANGATNGAKPRPKRTGHESAIGEHKHKRTGIDLAIGLLTPLVGQEFLDKYGLRDPLNRTLRYGTRTIFSAAGATTRQFKKVQNLRGGPTRLKTSGRDYYDLTPDDDQKLIVETVEQFAAEVLRPAAHDADAATSYPPDLVKQATELGITAINIPEDFDGIAAERSSVTNVLVAEALAYGDMGLALPILAPAGVAAALTHWGSAGQQATYLNEFAGESVPQACVAIAEPQPLFDPTALKTTAVRTPGGYRLNGVKSLVPAAADAELFIVAAQLNGKPALFIVESSSEGLTVRADPSMGIRAAALGRVELDNVAVPLSARLGEDGATDADYSEAIALVAAGLGRARGRHVARGARLRDPVRQGTGSVRRAHRSSPVGRLHVRQHRHRTRWSATDHLAWSGPGRSRSLVQPGGRAGQAARQRQGHADRPGRRATARWPRLHQGAPRRALVPRPSSHRCGRGRRSYLVVI